ncbi:MAG TPA: hypothetical protein VGP68_04715 [Gemmataceae bacterium]|jgi:hypothetical protein|nr:hypothetical protein [Gemmataceae bacterium]
MNGFIKKQAAGLCLIGGLAALSGCACYRDIVDPCYPARYEAESRNLTIGAMAPQVNNGHVLEQTIWNYHFEAGTDKLTPGGVQALAYLARRRPSPDPVIYVQTAQDLTLDAVTVDKFADERGKLDGRRVEAVRKSLAALTAGRGVNFEVLVHDPHEVGMTANFMARQVNLRDAGVQGVLTAPSSSTSGGGGASSGGGGGGGGSSGGGGSGGGGGGGSGH